MAQEPAMMQKRLPTLGELVVQEIVRQIERIAGGKFFVNIRVDMIDAPIQLTWYYDCPCGETSGYSMLYDLDRYERSKTTDLAGLIKYQVDVALESMRIHVRSEGNEPSF